jgi:hypothetical protein
VEEAQLDHGIGDTLVYAPLFLNVYRGLIHFAGFDSKTSPHKAYHISAGLCFCLREFSLEDRMARPERLNRAVPRSSEAQPSGGPRQYGEIGWMRDKP